MNVARWIRLFALVAVATIATGAHAAFVVEADNVDPAGKANDHFSSLGHSLSTGFSTAAGLAGNQSAFGNAANATGPDEYTFRYTPGTDVDNTVYAAAQVLGNASVSDADGVGLTPPIVAAASQLATGLVGGGSGIYNVYFTVPSSTNVDLAGSIIRISNAAAELVHNPVNLNNLGTGPDVNLDGDGNPQTNFVGGANHLWLKIGTVALTAGNAYTVTVTANSPTFVSTRAHGVMWEYVGPVPEPASLALAGVAGLALAAARRRP